MEAVRQQYLLSRTVAAQDGGETAHSQDVAVSVTGDRLGRQDMWVGDVIRFFPEGSSNVIHDGLPSPH